MKKGKMGYKENISKILAIFFCVFPWITYVKLLEYDEAEMSVFSSYEGLALDFFLYYKERILIAMAVFVVCWFIGERIFPDKVDNNVPLLKGKNKWLLVLSGLFLGGALLSTVFSQYQKNAWWGSPSEGEGFFTLLGYAVLIFAFYNYFARESALKLMKKGISVLSIVTVILSFIEYFFKPLVEIELVQKLIAPVEYGEVLGTATAEAFDGAVSLTFNNPGYYGGFVCILFPFMVTGFFSAEKVLEQVLYGLLSTGLMFGVIVSNSTAALYVAVAELVFCIVVYMWKAFCKKDAQKNAVFVKCGVMIGAVFAAVVLYSVASGSSIWDIVTNANSATGKVREDRFVITDIELQENAVYIEGKENGLKIAFSDGQVMVFDEENNSLDAEYVDGALVFADEAYKDITVGIVTNSDATSQVWAKLAVDAGYDDTVDFFILRDGSISGIGQNNAILMDIDGEDVPEGLKKYYGIFTGRGYAWVNSLPILKDTILKGVGPGNFAYYFKQQDYVGMLQTHESTKLVIDKPHNAYLQYAINLGVPGMLGFFGILAYALVKGVLFWWNQKKGEMDMEPLHLGAMISIVGFAVSSLMNDSTVAVTPTICMVAGLVLAMNYMLAGGNTNGKVKK